MCSNRKITLAQVQFGYGNRKLLWGRWSQLSGDVRKVQETKFSANFQYIDAIMFAHGALPQTPLGAYSDPQLGNIGSHPCWGPHTIAGPRAPRPHDPPLCITFFDINPFLTVVIIRVPIRQHVSIPLQGPSKPKPKPSGSDIAAQAEKHIGNTTWAKKGCHWPGCNENKCNTFVAEMIKDAGIKPPERYIRTSH